jgi:hypothetical protein
MSARPVGPGLERDQARFYAKVALPNEQGCMLWLKGKSKQGYGMFFLNGLMVLAHRFSYELAYGEIPEGLEIDHVKARGCNNRHCVAPAHLEAVTQQENIRRGEAGSQPREHCPQGHPYAGDNLYIAPNRSRHCRACGRVRARDYQRKKARQRADAVS